MNYILTEAEYQALVSKEVLNNLVKAHEVLWKHYCSLANPVCRGDSEMGRRDLRCDNCPISSLLLSRVTEEQVVAGIKPLSYDVAKLVCPRRQEYSK